jgi:epsilon-lactone hydrolase
MSRQQLQTIVQMLRSQPVVKPDAPVQEARAGFEQIASMFPVDADIKREAVDAGRVKAEWLSAPDADMGRAVLYLHGGGYVIGSINTHRSLAARLSRASKARVLVIDYRLAPEDPHPAAVEDSVAAYRWMLAQGLKPARIAVAGDSAGGGLTVSTLVAIRDAKLPLPAAGACLSPWVDLEGIGGSMTTKADIDPIVQKAGIEQMAAAYLGGKDPRTPLAAPPLRRSHRASAASHSSRHGRDAARRRRPSGRACPEGRGGGELRAVRGHDPRVAPVCFHAR